MCIRDSIIYCFGLFALNAMLLFLARKPILAKRPTATPLSRAIRFLYREYEPWAFWWELMEMARRLVLVGIFVLIQRGSIVQIVLGTIFSAVYLLLQMQAAPFHDTGDDYLANGASFSLVVFFICCLVFKAGSLAELEVKRRREHLSLIHI